MVTNLAYRGKHSRSSWAPVSSQWIAHRKFVESERTGQTLYPSPLGMDPSDLNKHAPIDQSFLLLALDTKRDHFSLRGSLQCHPLIWQNVTLYTAYMLVPLAASQPAVTLCISSVASASCCSGLITTKRKQVSFWIFELTGSNFLARQDDHFQSWNPNMMAT